MQKDGKLQQLSLLFSIKLVKLHDKIPHKAFLKNQMAWAGTSIGANIHEATYAESPDDFIHKMSIALKECYETEYWLSIMSATCPELNQEAEDLKREAGSMRRMLIASISTVKARFNISKQ